MEKEICEVISRVLGRKEEEVRNANSFRQLGMDSLQRLEIVMEIEEQFQVVITDEEGEAFTSVADVIALLVEKKSRGIAHA